MIEGASQQPRVKRGKGNPEMCDDEEPDELIEGDVDPVVFPREDEHAHHQQHLQQQLPCVGLVRLNTDHVVDTPMGTGEYMVRDMTRKKHLQEGEIVHRRGSPGGAVQGP